MIGQDQLPSTPGAEDRGGGIAPLEGELGIPSVANASRPAISWKGIFALALMVLSLVAVTAAAFNRAVSGHRKDQAAARLATEQPAAAANEPRRLDMTLAAAPPVVAVEKRIPAIVPMDSDTEPPPIRVRHTGSSAPGTAAQAVAPEDAPVLLVASRPGSPASGFNVNSPGPGGPGPSTTDEPLEATRRNLEAYQRQLQNLLDTLIRQAGAPDASTLLGQTPAAPLAPLLPTAEAGRLFGGQLQSSATPLAMASRLRNRGMTLPKGTSFTCALRTRIISATSGMVGCQVQRNVYGDDGRVLLIERGSQVDGEYRIASVQPGTVRIPVLWTRVRTPHGVIVDIESPATGPLGESGIEGYVDNRWKERLGAAMLLSLIDDAVKLTIQNQASDREASTIILPSTSSNTGKLAEKVLDSTINIPPLIYQNQGGIVGIYVARDVDFSSVYELKAVPR